MSFGRLPDLPDRNSSGGGPDQSEFWSLTHAPGREYHDLVMGGVSLESKGNRFSAARKKGIPFILPP